MIATTSKQTNNQTKNRNKIHPKNCMQCVIKQLQYFFIIIRSLERNIHPKQREKKNLDQESSSKEVGCSSD
jgi:hypothetical protein